MNEVEEESRGTASLVIAAPVAAFAAPLALGWSAMTGSCAEGPLGCDAVSFNLDLRASRLEKCE